MKFRGQRRSATNDQDERRFFAGVSARAPSLVELASIYQELRNIPNPPDILSDLFRCAAEVPELLDKVFSCRAFDLINDVELAAIRKRNCSPVSEAALATNRRSAILAFESNKLK